MRYCRKSGSEFIAINVKVEALKRMLQGHTIHACDIHCADANQKAALQQLLLQVITSARWE